MYIELLLEISSEKWTPIPDLESRNLPFQFENELDGFADLM